MRNRAAQVSASSSLGYLQLAAVTRVLTHLLPGPKEGYAWQLYAWQLRLHDEWLLQLQLGRQEREEDEEPA
jgi:hypothetical protein